MLDDGPPDGDGEKKINRKSLNGIAESGFGSENLAV